MCGIMWPIGDGHKQKRIIKFGKITSWDKQTNKVTIEKDFKKQFIAKRKHIQNMKQA